MRTLTIFTFLLFSQLTFASPSIQCGLTAAAPGAPSSKEIANPVLKIDNTLPLQKIGSWNGLTFSFAFIDSGAVGPFDMVAIEWTDGVNTFQNKQIYTPGTKVFLMADIKGQIGTVFVGCGNPPGMP